MENEILLKADQLENSVSMSYYGMYNITLALLFRLGIKCENHTGAHLLLSDILEERELSTRLEKAKKERIDKQYYPNFDVTKNETELMLRDAKNFVSEVKSKIISLTESEVIKVRKNSLSKICFLVSSQDIPPPDL